MNYRQWKKNYKKKHGYNPLLVDDKRLQVRQLKRTLNQLHRLDIDDMAKTIINGISNAFKIIGEAFTNAGNSLEVNTGEWNPYKLSDFEWEVLQVYLKHGYFDAKLYHTLFFCASLNDETALMTLAEFAEKAVDLEDNLWMDKIKTE